MLLASGAAPAFAQVDFTGQWAPLYHEDTIERIPGPELADYTGLPLNEAGRLRADSWDADRISVVQEYQCRPHSSDYSARPLHTIVNTHLHADHIGGTGALIKLLGGGPQAPRVMAHENVLRRLQQTSSTREAPLAALALNAVIVLPVTSTYFTPSRDFFLNGEAVVLYHAPNAHADGDTMVYFRGSDVISAGDVFTPDLYPFIDLQNGGSVNGEIAALNHILEIAVPAKFQEGGTYIVPGHGRLCDEADVVEYRDMVTIIRDRIQDLIARKMALAQVKAARPTRDYDTEYGADTGTWTTEMFVEAVYRSLTDGKK